MTKLSIIILTYNSAKHIKFCIDSIFDFYSLALVRGEYELLIVDNASSDTTLPALEKYFNEQFKKNMSFLGSEKEIEVTKYIKIIKHKENFGFAKGMNQAVGASQGEYVLFLNPDSEMLDGNLSEMIEIMESNRSVGTVCGKVMTQDDKEEKTCGKFYNFFSIVLFVMGLDEHVGLRSSPSEKQYIDYGSGGFMLVDKEKFNSARGFDENFFMYIEDMEFCYRMKKSGYLTMFYPYATIRHHGQGSSDRTYAVISILKGMIYFFKKHRTPFFYKFARILLIGKARLGILIGGLTHNTYLTRTYKKALNILV